MVSGFLVTTAFATSLDAMAVGVGLAFLQVSIVTTALAIGCATFIASDAGDDGRSLYRPAVGQTSRNSRRYRADWRIGSEILWSHFAG